MLTIPKFRDKSYSHVFGLSTEQGWREDFGWWVNPPGIWRAAEGAAATASGSEFSSAPHRTGPLDSWVLGDKWQDANLNWGYWKINEQRTLMSTHISFIRRIKNFLNLRKQLWDLVWIKTRYCNQFFSSLQFIQCTSLHSCSFRKHYNFNLFQQIIYAFQYFSILFLSMCFTILHTILVHELLK